MRAEGIALGDIEGGHRGGASLSWSCALCGPCDCLGRVIRAVHVWVFHVFRVVAAQVTGSDVLWQCPKRCHELPRVVMRHCGST